MSKYLKLLSPVLIFISIFCFFSLSQARDALAGPCNGTPYPQCGQPNLNTSQCPYVGDSKSIVMVTHNTDCSYTCVNKGEIPGQCGVPAIVTGYFDVADCSSGLQGWACDQSNGSSSITVNFYTDAGFTNLIGSTVANIPRADVAAAGDCQSTPNHGFAFQIPASLNTGTQQTIYAAAIDSSGNKVALNTSPKTLTCTAPVNKKYVCSNNACVEDDTNGTFTDSSCNNSCTPAVTQHTTINLALQLMGIGVNGNINPKHPTRPVHIQIYNSSDDSTQPNVNPVLDSTTQTVTFNSYNGYFLNTSVDLGTSLPAGSYQILVKTPGYLRKQVVDSQGGKVFTLTPGQTTILPSVQLIAGDTAPLYNTISSQDFYAIVDCYNGVDDPSSTPPTNCAAGTQITDLNDDGVVDGVDLNIWLLGMQQLLSSNNSTGTGDGATGN